MRFEGDIIELILFILPATVTLGEHTFCFQIIHKMDEMRICYDFDGETDGNWINPVTGGRESFIFSQSGIKNLIDLKLSVSDCIKFLEENNLF